jgi:RimJ/RimL family protein N-acetyltransferase
MGELSDRPVVADDAAWIVELHAAAHARAFMMQPTEEQVRASIGRDGFAEYVVLDGDERVGLWRASLEQPWVAEVRTIIAAVPGRGVGTFALQRALAWAFTEHHVHRAYLYVKADNARARQLYERLGFRYEGTFRDGFRERDGSYADLCGYGILAGDEAAP